MLPDIDGLAISYIQPKLFTIFYGIVPDEKYSVLHIITLLNKREQWKMIISLIFQNPRWTDKIPFILGKMNIALYKDIIQFSSLKSIDNKLQLQHKYYKFKNGRLVRTTPHTLPIHKYYVTIKSQKFTRELNKITAKN